MMHPHINPYSGMDDTAWESLWAPYDQPTYQAVLAQLVPEDVVLEIGAGDLRLARLMAEAVRRVYAIEIQADLVEQALTSAGEPLPANLAIIKGDACSLPFPSDIITAVLLMRHCTHFKLYVNKLKSAGCQRLITNARWRMGVEVLSFQDPRTPFALAPMGWYACWCGAVGFKPGDAGLFTPDQDNIVHEVTGCPKCQPLGEFIQTCELGVSAYE